MNRVKIPVNLHLDELAKDFCCDSHLATLVKSVSKKELVNTRRREVDSDRQVHCNDILHRILHRETFRLPSS